jgi:tetratricopeptide (TPR) repeat protein
MNEKTQTPVSGERHPDYIRAIFDRAVTMIREGRLDSAEVLLQTLSGEPSATEAASYLRGVIASSRMEKAAAQSFFRKALEANPQNADAHAQLGLLLLEDQPASAAAAFAAALALDARDPDRHIGLADALDRLGFADLAKGSLVDALARAPDHPKALELAAAIDARAPGPEAEGLSAEEEAILCDALFSEGTRRLGEGDLARAKALYERVLARAPSHAFTLCNLGALARDQGELARSEELIRRALAADEKLVPAHLVLAETLLESGRRDAARAQFERAIALEPQSAAACAAYAMALHRMGASGDAMPWFHRAVMLDQDQPADFFAALGAALEAMGMHDRAEIALQHAAALGQARAS